MARGRIGKTKKKFDRAKIERAIGLLLDGVGEDISRAGLRETPRRVCDLYEEILSGMWTDPGRHLQPIITDYQNDLVVVRDIRFTSVCEHHLLPFMGRIGVAYVPHDGHIVGISKIVRAVEVVSHRLQIQERMTSQLADVINQRLKPSGVLVIVEAEHLCMTVRGVKKPDTIIVTTEARGILKQPERQTLALSSLCG